MAVIGLGLLGLLAAGIARAAGCPVLGIDLDPRAGGTGAHDGRRRPCCAPQAEEAAPAFSHGPRLRCRPDLRRHALQRPGRAGRRYSPATGRAWWPSARSG